VHTKTETRRYLDCREFNRHGQCSLRLAGTQEEVVAAALEHAVSAHGYRGSEELRLVLRAALKDEPDLGALGA